MKKTRWIKIILAFFILIIMFRSITLATNININARAAIVYERNSKRILYEKNINTKLPNASTTKVLTAIVAFENGNMSEKIKISKQAANVSGSSIGLRTDDEITLNDLMNGMLICSGNDAATAIAEHIGGSVENFCNMMNKKAIEIGATNTHFLTPHGLDNEGHYSTAYDLALISDYALNIPYIAEILSKKSEIITINGSSKSIHTTNEMLSFFEGADGVKTGYTGDAGRCLITSATRDNWQIISVVLGCDTKNNRTQDSAKLLNYAFNEFKLIKINDLIKNKFVIYADNAKKERYEANVINEVIYPLSSEEINKMTINYNINKKIDAKNFNNPLVGTINIFLEDTEICKMNVKIEEKVIAKTTIDFLKDIIKSFLKCSKYEFFD